MKLSNDKRAEGWVQKQNTTKRLNDMEKYVKEAIF